MSAAYLLVLGDREAIAWVLREQRMAFPRTPRAEVAAAAPGDRLYLYSPRGAWHNPTHDRGRVIGDCTGGVARPRRWDTTPPSPAVACCGAVEIDLADPRSAPAQM